MKYIRTKDGIYEYQYHEEIDCIRASGDVFDCDEILKQANTIEELCDEFVLDHPLFSSNCKILYHNFERAKNGIKKRSGDAHDLYDFVIYGSIWVDGNLIKVAKMNDKGELELL